jgi:hypothetical protein
MSFKKVILPIIIVAAVVVVLLFVFVFNSPKIKLYEQRTLNIQGVQGVVYSYYTEKSIEYDSLKEQAKKLLDKNKKENEGENVFIYIFKEEMPISEISNYVEPLMMAISVPENNLEFIGDSLDQQEYQANTALKIQLATDFQSIRMAGMQYYFKTDSDEFALEDLSDYLNLDSLSIKDNYRLEKNNGVLYVISKKKIPYTEEELSDYNLELIDGYPAYKLDYQ